jgi:hypothetical protein
MADVHKGLSHLLDLFTGEAQGNLMPAQQVLPVQEFTAQEVSDQA